MEKWGIFRGSKYEISDLGRIRLSNGKILKDYEIPRGYKKIKLVINNKRETFFIHRLVGEVFIGNVNGFVVDHINRNTSDNRLINLRIVTTKENNKNRRIRRIVGLDIISKIINLNNEGFSIYEIDNLINICSHTKAVEWGGLQNRCGEIPNVSSNLTVSSK